MTRPAARVREADAVDELLDNLAPEAPAAPDRYASATVDRYAAAVVDRYAATVADRYAVATTPPSRYDRAIRPDRYAAARTGPRVIKRPRPVKRTIVVVEPPSPFKGEMAYLACSEWERCYEYEYAGWNSVWGRGDVVDFTNAAESQWENQMAYGNEGTAGMLLTALQIESVTRTFNADSEIWGEHESDLWIDMMKCARKIRGQLVADPGLVLDCLEDYRWAAILSGWTEPQNPDQTDVLAALKVSTSMGLGASAIDLCVWNGSPNLDDWSDLEDLVEMIRSVDYVHEGPVENFILDTGDLHVGTHGTQGHGGSIWYDLFGQYVVMESVYYSDLCRTQPYGWRNSHLVPGGTPVLPKFKECPEDQKYPGAPAVDANQLAFDTE